MARMLTPHRDRRGDTLKSGHFARLAALESVRVLRASALAFALTALSMFAACEGAGSDLRDFGATFTPPSPQEAAMKVTNPSDPEAQRSGVVLLSSAPWGGSPVYVKLYRLYVEENTDPLVRAAAILALGRHGDPTDAELIAKQLTHNSKQVRLAAALALQRLHDVKVADAMWRRLIEDREEAEVRVELAIGLAQYPTDAVFQALCTALDQRELSVNIAASDSLRLLTNHDYGMDRKLWLAWAKPQKSIFDQRLVYLYPTYQRPIDGWDVMVFWQPITWDKPALPTGMVDPGLRPTNPDEFENIGDGAS